jgi:DNA (cytosine-5)-methyltransferase 1
MPTAKPAPSSRPKADALRQIEAVDLFCGAGGLSYGLTQAGVKVGAGVDLDPRCRYPFESNLGAEFHERDVRELEAVELSGWWSERAVRLLAGCAPCQPFSPYRRGQDTSAEEDWSLLEEFGRLVGEVWPELVTMENVPRIGTSKVFLDFVDQLGEMGYWVDYRSCYGPTYGLPQARRRLVLVASLLGPVHVPEGTVAESAFPTVETTIKGLPQLESGEVDPKDPLHRSRNLSETNLKRIRASKPGGTWKDWPKSLRAPCHQRASGATYRNVYARMRWDQPSPTITTLSHNFGAGRFGHPAQDRPISLREAAMLQGFPQEYAFVEKSDDVSFTHHGRLIGNAVPPPLGRAIGRALVEHVSSHFG